MHLGKNLVPTLKQAHATTPAVIKTEFVPPSAPKLGCSGGQKFSPIFNHGLLTLTYSCCQHCAHIVFPCLIPDTDFFIDIPILFWFCECSFKCYVFHSSPVLLHTLSSKRSLGISKNKLRPREHEFDCMEE